MKVRPVVITATDRSVEATLVSASPTRLANLTTRF